MYDTLKTQLLLLLLE